MIGAQGQREKTSNARACAAELRALGFALCRPDPGTKKPTYLRWPTLSLDPDDFAEDDLIGILGGPLSSCGLPGHALIIIDLDEPPAVEQADDHLPATPAAEGREGKPRDHRYFLVPFATIPSWAESPAVQASIAAKKATGHPGPFKKQFLHAETKECFIDFLGTGSQAVCPGGASPRQWVSGSPCIPAIVPFSELWDAVCRLALACGCKLPDVGDKAKAKGKESGSGKGFKATATNGASPEARARAWLRKVPGAISGQGGHAQTYTAAVGVVVGFGLGVERGLSLLLSDYNPRCQPSWTEAELRHKCEDADTKPHDKPRGWLLTEENEDSGFCTDQGNGVRLGKRIKGKARHCWPWNKWPTWDGRRWAEDDTGAIMREAKGCVLDLFWHAAQEIKKAVTELQQHEEENTSG